MEDLKLTTHTTLQVSEDIVLQYITCAPRDSMYPVGWYYQEDEDTPPTFCGVASDTAKAYILDMLGDTPPSPAAGGPAAQHTIWADEDLLYALCAVCKRMDQGDDINLRDAFLQTGNSVIDTDAALDLIYQKVLE